MFSLQLPATSANLGCGFDSLGIAWDFGNRWEVEPSSESLLIEDGQVTPHPQRTLLWKAMYAAFVEADRDPIPLKVVKDCAVPISSGLGSSAAAIAGGLRAANLAMGSPLSLEDLVDLAARLEGHPDNTTPALTGGLTSCVMADDQVMYSVLPVHPDLTFCVAMANFSLSTQAAREILPQTYSRADAVHNISRSTLMMQALRDGRAEWLKELCDDRIHQPFRRHIIAGYDEMERLAYDSGASAFCLSGAGPTLLMIGGKDDAWIDVMRQNLGQLSEHWTLRQVKPLAPMV